MRNLSRAAIVAVWVSFPALLHGQHAGSLLVLSKRDHTLAVVDPGSLKVTARVPVGDDPHEVIATADGTRAYVSHCVHWSRSQLAISHQSICILYLNSIQR